MPLPTFINLFIMNDRILELYCSVDEPQHLAGFTVASSHCLLTFKSLKKTIPKSFSDATVSGGCPYKLHSNSILLLP